MSTESKKLPVQVSNHLDDYKNWVNKRDWLNTADILSNRFPEFKTIILERVAEIQRDAKNEVHTNKIMQRAGMIQHKRTKRGFGARKSPKTAQGGDCTTGDCDEEQTSGKKRMGLHRTAKNKKKSDLMQKSSKVRKEGYKEKLPSGQPTDKITPAGETPLKKQVLEEIGIGIITDTKSLRKFFAKKDLDAPLYKRRLIDMYKFSYPAVHGVQLEADFIQEMEDMKPVDLEKLYLNLVDGFDSETSFTA